MTVTDKDVYPIPDSWRQEARRLLDLEEYIQYLTDKNRKFLHSLPASEQESIIKYHKSGKGCFRD